MSNLGTVPPDVWQEACGFAEQAVKVRDIYEDRTMFFIESAKMFLVCNHNAGVKEIAERLLARNVEDLFQQEFLNQTLLQLQAQRERASGAKTND